MRQVPAGRVGHAGDGVGDGAVDQVLAGHRGRVAERQGRAFRHLQRPPDVHQHDALGQPPLVLLRRQELARHGLDGGRVVIHVGVVDRRMSRALEGAVAHHMAEHQDEFGPGHLLHQLGRLREVDVLDLGRIGKIAAGGRPVQPGEASGLQAEAFGPQPRALDPHRMPDQGEGRLVALGEIDPAGGRRRIDVADRGLEDVLRLERRFGVHGLSPRKWHSSGIRR